MYKAARFSGQTTADGKLAGASPAGQALVRDTNVDDNECVLVKVAQQSKNISVYVPVVISGVPVKLLLDTGASRTIIGKSVLESLCEKGDITLEESLREN